MKHISFFKKLFYLLFSIILLSSCGHNEFESEQDDTPTTVPKHGSDFKFYTDSNLFYKLQARRASSSSASYAINEVVREGDKLKISVSYSGGCREHEFDLVWDGVVSLSNPGRAKLIIRHNPNGDKCKSLINKTLEVDLKTYFNNLIEINNTEFKVLNASSIQDVNSVGKVLSN